MKINSIHACDSEMCFPYLPAEKVDFDFDMECGEYELFKQLIKPATLYFPQLVKRFTASFRLW